MSTSELLLEFPILGIGVTFSTPDRAVANVLEELYGRWRAVAVWPRLISRLRPRPSIRVRVCSGSMPERRGALETRAPTPSTLTVRGPTVRGAANTSRRTAHCVIHESALHDPERLRIELLDTLLIFLLTRLDRVPLHAATVCDADVGLVLFGPSGVGKSTLAHIAGRAGLQSLTDDITYVQLEPRFRLWGFARTPRPRARDADMRAPKPTVPAQPLNVLPPIREFAGVCLLERGGPQSGALRALSFEECLQRVLNNLEPGFDVFRNELEPRLRALTAGGAWLLQMPSSPDAAVPFLSELIAAVRNRRHLRTRERTDSRP